MDYINRNLFFRRWLLGIACALPCYAAAAGHEHHDMAHHHGMMDHSSHVMPSMAVTRSEAEYVLPEVVLTDTEGAPQALAAAVGDGPVMLNFIYTSCTTVCPPMSATFAAVQQELAHAARPVRLISVSIDPEHDTPARLKAYAAELNAGADWKFLTGTVADTVAVQRAFQVWRGNKMNHAPVTLLRAGAGKPWTRVEGFASADDLVRELQRSTMREVAARR